MSFNYACNKISYVYYQTMSMPNFQICSVFLKQRFIIEQWINGKFLRPLDNVLDNGVWATDSYDPESLLPVHSQTTNWMVRQKSKRGADNTPSRVRAHFQNRSQLTKTLILNTHLTNIQNCRSSWIKCLILLSLLNEDFSWLSWIKTIRTGKNIVNSILYVIHILISCKF